MTYREWFDESRKPAPPGETLWQHAARHARLSLRLYFNPPTQWWFWAFVFPAVAVASAALAYLDVRLPTPW